MAERRRILLAEVVPKVPQAPVFCTWNPLDKHADIALTVGDTRAMKIPTHATAWACVRGTQRMDAGQWYWETQYYYYTAGGDVVSGIARDAVSVQLNVQPGAAETIACIGGPDRTGQCRTNMDGTVALGAIANTTIVRHWLDVDAGTYRVAVGAGLWTSVVPTGGESNIRAGGWYAIIGMKRGDGGQVFSDTNFGASSFAFPAPAGVHAGVYTVPAPVATVLYIGSEGFNTGGKDTPADTHYMGRIAGNQDVEVEREGGCWVWGNQGSSQRGQLTLVNTDGALDPWLDYVWSDATVQLYSGYEGDERADFTLWTRAAGASIRQADGRLILTLTDSLALLDAPLQTRMYPQDTPNTSLVGKPKPLVIGRPLYCSPPLLDTSPTARLYEVHDAGIMTTLPWGDHLWQPLGGISQIYDRGDLFSGPNDPYTAHNPITTATSGAAGGGGFSSWPSDGSFNVPFNFKRLTTFGTANDRFYNTSSRLGCQSSGQVTTAIYHNTSVLLAGYRYEIKFYAYAATTGGTLTFRLDGATTPIVDRRFTFTSAGWQTITIDCVEDAQLQIVLGASELDAIIDSLTVSSVQVIDWTFELTNDFTYPPRDRGSRGFKLANRPDGKVTCNPIGPHFDAGLAIERMEDVVTMAVALIPAARNSPWLSLPSNSSTPNPKVADFITNPRTGLQLARDACDARLGWVISDRAGELRYGLIADPETETPVLTLDATNVVGEPKIEDDVARGLTLTVEGRRNHSPMTDSDVAGSVSEAMRAELTSEYTRVRNADPSLAEGVVAAYPHASGAPGKKMLLQQDADIQWLANRVGGLWNRKRRFYTLTAVLGASAADALEPGQIIRLVWARYGLASGKNVLVVGVRSRFFSRRCELKLWG